MRFSIVALVTLAAGVLAGGSSAPVVYTTEVVTSIETYCPEATSFVHGSSTYIVSTPSTVTLTGATYTVTRPLMSSTVTICHPCATGTAPTIASSAVPTVSPVYPGSTLAITATTSPAPLFTAGANRLAGAGAGLAGLAGVAAFLL